MAGIRRENMRIVHLTLALAYTVSSVLVAQDAKPKLEVSKARLTAEQVAVYRAVLKDYIKGGDGSLNIANKTVPLDQSEIKSGDGCLRGIELEKTTQARSAVHVMDSSVLISAKMVLVDPDKQKDKIDQNDPSRLIRGAIEEGEKVREEQIGDSVKQAFQTGLFTFSEIVFDRQHQHAVLSYAFHCGELCGHGNTMVLRKVDKKWKVNRHPCNSWIS
jgi:hypothetical protein